MKDLIKSTVVALAATIAFQPTVLTAQDLSVQDLSIQERKIHRRGIEAITWSMPLINFMAMRDGLKKDAGVGFNDVVYNSKVQTWRLQVTTANNTTPYVFIFWNVKDGPVVIDIPPSADGVALFGTLMDAWQRPLKDVGAKGTDQGRGAKYAIFPPGYEGPLPAGYVSSVQKTYNGYTLMRPIIANASDANLKKAEAIVKKIKVYPLAQADHPPATKYVDIYNMNIDGVAHFDASYFDNLNSIIQEEVIERKDLAMMGLLKSIGIEKGKPYEVDARRTEILADAAKEAHEFLIDLYFNSGLTGSFYDNRRWSVLTPATAAQTGVTFELPGYLDIDGRGGSYYAFFTSVKNFNLFNPPTMYLLASKDKDGQQLSGSENYKLTVPKDVPVEEFWSVIVYTIEDATWFDNQPKAGVASSDRGLQVNKDGTVDVYFGSKAPVGKEANWVPTTPGKDYFLYFRLYGPKAPLFTKTWRLNDVDRIGEQ